MSRYEAIVYDLDGTLVRLDVDWKSVRSTLAAKLRARSIDPEGKSLWELFDEGESDGYWPVVHETLEEFERDGARTSDRLAQADHLPRKEAVGVCSLNAESACRIALEIHGLDGYVDVIVGRDSAASYKPDPEALLETLQQLDVEPQEALFVGDSMRDQETAERAGVDFRAV